MKNKNKLRKFAPLIASITLACTSLGSFADGHEKSEKENATVHKGFTQCVAVRMREINIKHLDEFDPEKHATTVPEGWTVISGSGGEGHPKLLLCR